jgi:IS4 transposase
MNTQRVDLSQSEFEGAQLGDSRLSQRLGKIVAALSANPSGSFPKALRDSASLEAFYRFADNSAVSAAGVLAPHQKKTLERIGGRKRILLVQDTTECRFTGEAPRLGSGPLAGGGAGFYAHVCLAVSDDGKRDPLGVIGLRTYVHPVTQETAAEKKKKGRKSRPDSESQRWIEMAKTCEEEVGKLASVIHVADREADFYEAEANLVANGSDFVFRVQHDRVLERINGKAVFTLNDALAGAKVVATREVPLSRRLGSTSPRDRKAHPAREARLARLEISATTIDLPATSMVRGLGLPKKIRLNLVQAVEVNAPAGMLPVDWQLLTTLPIDTPEQILDILDIYRARWIIEELFKALKTGCSFEKRQLSSVDALVVTLALLLPIAWQMLRLRHLVQIDDKSPASDAISEQQLSILQVFQPKQMPALPTVKDALLAIAAMGGHIKNNGLPGWMVLGRGFERLLNIEDGWQAALEFQSKVRN